MTLTLAHVCHVIHLASYYIASPVNNTFSLTEIPTTKDASTDSRVADVMRSADRGRQTPTPRVL